ASEPVAEQQPVAPVPSWGPADAAWSPAVPAAEAPASEPEPVAEQAAATQYPAFSPDAGYAAPEAAPAWSPDSAPAWAQDAAAHTWTPEVPVAPSPEVPGLAPEAFEQPAFEQPAYEQP